MSSAATTASLNTSVDPGGNRPLVEPGDDHLPFPFETRLAVVLYGGVSLAIYINGVAQELLHLVRASAPDSRTDPTGPRIAEPAGVEKVYREVICRLGARGALRPECGTTPLTRVVVDVIAGTSAGGLNGLFLAKALANGGDMETLRRLWIEQGDLDVLLNDGRSRKGLPLRRPRNEPLESLLNSPRMYYQLFRALHTMTSAPDASAEPIFADELDLFVTATDLTGLPMPLRIANGLVWERRHKGVFHFLGASAAVTGRTFNDFTAANDPFLAFAGRCTSSFPLAFEPMQLGDIERIETDGVPRLSPEVLERWQRFYRDYLRRSEETGVPEDDQRASFRERSFGDGGYLDNKPFSRAIEALQWRHAGANVRRKLIYVEPSPEHPEMDWRVKPRPSAFENLVDAASTLPRKETIREDLERVLERNQRIEHVLRASRFVADDVHAAFPAGPPRSRPGVDYAARWLDQMTEDYGATYGAYHRLKVSELTTELAEVVTRVAGLDDRSDDLLAVRMLMSAWRQEHYDSGSPDDPRVRAERTARKLGAPVWESENRLLLDFDLSYRLRRIFFLNDIAQGLAALERDGRGDVGRSVTSPYAQDRAREILEAAGCGAEDVASCREHLPEFRAAIRAGLATLAAMYLELRTVGRTLRARARRPPEEAAGAAPPGDERSPLQSLLGELRVSREERLKVLAPSAPRDRVEIARQVLGYSPSPAGTPAPLVALREGRRAVLERAAEVASATLGGVFQSVAKAFADAVPALDALEAAVPAAGAERAAWAARRCLRFYYDRFEHYDVALFPMAYGASVGELAEVKVIRVSPEDASDLICERDRKTHELRIAKLAGTRLGNFGAFLDAAWRRSDILWGRLDAAEILLTQLLPPPKTDDEKGVRDGLVRRAQIEILEEELVPLGTDLGRRVLVEAFLHTPNRFPDPAPLGALLDCLGPHLEGRPALATLLQREPVMLAYRECFEKHRSLAGPVAYGLSARGVAIFGRILQQVSGPASRVTSTAGRAFAFTGRALWGFVEVAIPESFPSLLFVNWIQLLYLLEALLLLGGVVLNSPPAQRIGSLALIFTLGVHALWAALQLQFRGKKGILRSLVLAAGALFFLLAGIGAFMLPAFAARLGGWLAGPWHRLLALFGVG